MYNNRLHDQDSGHCLSTCYSIETLTRHDTAVKGKSGDAIGVSEGGGGQGQRHEAGPLK